MMRRAPERVERLALVDTTAAPDTPQRRELRHADLERVRRDGFDALVAELPARWLLPEHAADRSLHDRVVAMARACGPAIHRRQQAALMVRPDARPGLAAIACPTLVLCGREDRPNPLAMHEAIAAAIAGARLVVVERCGHLSPIERPDAVTAALRDWLGRVG